MSAVRKIMILLSAALLLACCSSSASADELDWLSKPSVAASAEDDTPRWRNGSQPSLRKVGGALAVVLGGFLLLTLLMRKQSPRLPVNEMMEPLGAVQIAPKVRLHLVRFGARILVLHIDGQNVQRVAELEDPQEVQQLLSARRDPQSAHVPVSVSALLQTVEHETPQALRGLH